MSEGYSEGYSESLTSVGVATLSALTALEAATRHLHPPGLGELRELLEPRRAALAQAAEEFTKAEPPQELRGFHERFVEGATQALRSITLFVEAPGPRDAITKILASMSALCRAQEALYTLHRFPPLSRYFVEPALHGRIAELDPEAPAGLRLGVLQTGGEEGAAERGGFALYVPETYDGSADWPLVVALHGGSGNGRDFLWTWLREARGRRFLLLAPTARGSTWSMMGPDVDATSLATMLEYVSASWRVDRSRVLLTGLSDGATYSLLLGLRPDSPFTALAPLSGVLHPMLAGTGAAEQVRGRRIYMVHGALDWMFPVALAREGHERLRDAGADIVYREIDDLSHTYARDENPRILEWFDPSLVLPT